MSDQKVIKLGNRFLQYYIYIHQNICMVYFYMYFDNLSEVTFDTFNIR